MRDSGKLQGCTIFGKSSLLRAIARAITVVSVWAITPDTNNGAKTMAKHWTDADFIVTDQSAAYDGSSAVNQRGYCRKCKCDMQRFGRNGQHGPLKHYSSHIRARQLGLWSGKDSRPQLTA